MAITQSGTPTTATNSTAGTACAPAIPTGMTANHDMFLVVAVGGSRTLATPAGWTVVGAQVANGTSVTLGVWRRRWVSGDGAPSVTWTTTAKNVGCIVPFLGCDATTIIDVTVPTFATGTSTTPTSPTATAVTMGACRLHIEGRASISTSAPTTTMKEAVDIATTTTTSAALALDYQIGMATNAAGSRLDTVTSGAWVAATVWIRPATADAGGWLRTAGGGTRGTAATTATATLSGSDCVGTTTGTTIVTAASLFNSAATCAVGGSASTVIPNATGQSLAGTVNIAMFQSQNQTATAGTAVSSVITRSAGNADSIEMWVGEFVGMLASGALDQSALAQSAAAATSLTITTPTTQNGATELAVWAATEDTNPGSFVGPSTNYSQQMLQTSGAAAFMPLYVQSRMFTGGSTESATITATAGDIVGGLVTFTGTSASAMPLLPHPRPSPTYLRM